MTTLGSLSYSLGLNADKFEKGMRKARASIKKFSGMVVKGAASLAKWASAITAAGTAVGGFFIKRQLDAIDRISKMSDELGFSTEALSAYALGAELTGVKFESLEKGLQRFTRRMGEAQNGYGAAVKGMQALGLSVEDLQNMRPEQAFMRVADSIKAMGSETERAAAAYALFGRQGQELMLFLTQGSEGMAAVRKEAEALGLTFDRKTGLAVEMANDAWTKFNRSLTGFWRKIAPGVAGILKVIFDRMTNITSQLNGIVPAMRTVSMATMTVMEAVGTAAARIGDGIMLVVDSISMVVSVALREIRGLQLAAEGFAHDMTEVLAADPFFGFFVGREDVESSAQNIALLQKSFVDLDLSAKEAWARIGAALDGGEGSLANSARKIFLEMRGQMEGFFREVDESMKQREAQAELVGKSVMTNFINGAMRSINPANIFDKLSKSKQIKSIGESMAKSTQSAMFKVWGAIGDRARRQFKMLSAEVSETVKMEFSGVTGSFRASGVGRNDEIRRNEERAMAVQESQLDVLRNILNQFLGGVPAG